MGALPHNISANMHFKIADKHAEAGNAKEMWHHLGEAQKHAANHARELSESGKHSASVAYRKMTLGQVAHASRKVVNKAISEFRMTKYSALSALWQVMKENGPRPYALAVPQIELAHSPSEIENILHKYGIKLRKSEELTKADNSAKHEEAFKFHASKANKYRAKGSEMWHDSRVSDHHMEMAQEHGWELGHKGVTSLLTAIGKVPAAKKVSGKAEYHPHDKLVGRG